MLMVRHQTADLRVFVVLHLFLQNDGVIVLSNHGSHLVVRQSCLHKVGILLLLNLLLHHLHDFLVDIRELLQDSFEDLLVVLETLYVSFGNAVHEYLLLQND
jgi:hypothetical protein